MAKRSQKTANPKPPRTFTLLTILTIIFFLFILSLIVSGFLLVFGSTPSSTEGNIAIVPIKGTILAEKSSGYLSSSSTTSDEVIKNIKSALKNDNYKVIVLEINSPGGSAVASDEIAQVVKKAKKKKPVIAWIREAGASGAYWIASSSDYIIANRMSITGSIGVIASHLGFSEFMDEHNVTYERYVGGKYKDLGSPFKETTPEERKLLQSKIDKIHEIFKEEVMENRNLTREEIDKIADGEFYLGEEALSLGLVDALGTEEDVYNYINQTYKITPKPVRYKKKTSFFNELLGVESLFSGTNPLASENFREKISV